MAEPTFSLSIARPELSLSALLVSGDDSETLSLVSFQAPGWVAAVTYPPPSPWFDGSTAVSSRWEHTSMGGVIRAEGATESALRTTVAALRNALGQFSYNVTVTSNGVADVWECDTGSLVPVERDYAELRRFVAFYNFTIPCLPGA
jgi:hypothetical protein